MRGTVAISAIAHIALIVGASIAFPDARPFEVEPMKPVPVDIVPASELTRLKAGEKKVAKAEQPEPKKAEPVKPAESEKNDPAKQTASLPPPPAPKPEEPKVAAPAPTPPRSQTKAEERKSEPEPAPKKPDPKDAPAEEAKKSEPVPLPPLRPAHVPPPKPAPKKEPKFDPDRIAALLDKSPSKSAPPPAAADTDSDRPAEGDPRGLDDRMSLSEIDALRTQISRCWSPPVGVMGASDLAVQLQLALNPDGTLTRPPEILTRGSGVAFLAAADSARRAVLRCQPYDLPISKYNAWRDIKVNFDPREMLGG